MAKRTRQEWNALVIECRNSTLSDFQWCKMNQISYSTFCYHIRRMRKEASELPQPLALQSEKMPVQEIVQIHLEESNSELRASDFDDGEITPSVSIVVGNITVNLCNHASSQIIRNTMSVLRELC